MRNLADRFVQLMGVFAFIVRVIETTAAAEVREPRSESNYEPFFQFERLKENLLHQLECLAKGLKDLDFWSHSVHGRDCERVSSVESSSRAGAIQTRGCLGDQARHLF